MQTTRRQFTTGLLAITALSGLPACVTTNKATGRTSFTGFYSIEDDIELGQKEYPKLIKSFGGKYEDNRLNRYVNEIGSKLGQNTEYKNFKYTFSVLNTPIVNAFALPGGYISISRGLLALASNEAELAGVLAHELGHVNARHTAERLNQGLLAQIGLVILGATTGSRIATDVASHVAAVYIQSYSRKQEFEADMLGVRYMSRTGYEPDAMVSFLDTLRDHSQLSARMRGLPPGKIDEFDIMSTHPRTKDRVKAAIKQAEILRPASPILGRERYLSYINGLTYGDDPEQGMILGRRFVHPGLRFEFTVPEGFLLYNNPDKVIAKHPENTIIVFTLGTMKYARDPISYLHQEWAKNLPLYEQRTLYVDGQNAATGFAQLSTKHDGIFDAQLLAVQGDANNVFRFLFLTPTTRGRNLSQVSHVVIHSFHRLDKHEVAKIKPMRLSIIQRRENHTINQLARTMPYGKKFNADAFRILNDLKPEVPLPPSGNLKIITL